jgi:FkbM family methyltransferase
MKQYNLAFDIGGYNGGYTSWLLTQPYKKIITIEPNPSSFQQLQQRFQNESRVILKNCAISNRAAPHLFWVSSRHPTLCTLSEKFLTASRFTGKADENGVPYLWDREIEVNCLTLEDLFKHFGIPDLIKIDVEGHELEVLRTLPKLHSIPQVIDITFELNEEFAFEAEQCIMLLERKGCYEFGLIDNDRPESYPSKFFSLAEFMSKFKQAFPTSRKDFFGMIFARTPNI